MKTEAICVECGNPYDMRLRDGSPSCSRCAYSHDAAKITSLKSEVKKMTEEEIRQARFEKLRNLDRTIAEEIFGWTPVRHEDVQLFTWRVPGSDAVIADRDVPYYTLREQDAFFVANEVIRKGKCSFGLWRHTGSTEWQAHFGDEQVGVSTLTGHVPEAICRAALNWARRRPKTDVSNEVNRVTSDVSQEDRK